MGVTKLRVPGAGFEPARLRGRGILSPLCLPIPPSGRKFLRVVWRLELLVGGENAEAGVGIEPAYTALQAAA